MRHEPRSAPSGSPGTPTPSPGTPEQVCNQPPGSHHDHGPAGAACPPSGVARLFVGRDDDITRLAALARLPTTRVLAITGPAGVGKTALAVHLAHRLREHYPDGYAFLNLQSSYGIPASPVAQETLVAHGHPSSLPLRRLLIVDDIGGIDRISPFLPTSDDSLLIVTSRNPLPDLGESAHQHTIAALTHDDATALVTSITRTTRPPDPPESLRDLAALCGNLPLALWIAAERTAARPLMPLAAITEDLRAESAPWLALAAGPERPDGTLQTVLTCCYNALPASLARAARLLAGHPGPDFNAAAAQVVLNRPTGQAHAALHALTAMHWVENPRHDRYRLPTAVRGFAAGRAQIEEKPDDQRHLVERVARWYLRNAHAAVVEIHASTVTPQAVRLPPPRDADGCACGRCWFAEERANLHAVATAAHTHHLHDLSSDLSGALSMLTELVESQ